MQDVCLSMCLSIQAIIRINGVFLQANKRPSLNTTIGVMLNCWDVSDSLYYMRHGCMRLFSCSSRVKNPCMAMLCSQNGN